MYNKSEIEPNQMRNIAKIRVLENPITEKNKEKKSNKNSRFQKIHKEIFCFLIKTFFEFNIKNKYIHKYKITILLRKRQTSIK